MPKEVRETMNLNQ
ncbi:MAG: hypothetical protein LBF15_04535 [Candidatus Peribacteria bacterium]|nr:hypothetical protein [Candidatus Peribacteria bacterium]